MSIQSEIENAFSEDDVTILQTMADQVANALQNAYLFGQTQARAEELVVLNEMSQSLSRHLEVNAILRSVYLFASRLVDTSTFFIALHDKATNEISFPFATEKNRELLIPSRPLSAGLTEYVIQNRTPVLIKNDVAGWLKERNIELHLTGELPNSWLGVPMTIGDNALGIICVQHEKPQHFREQHRDLLVAIANQSAIALQNAQLFFQTQEALADTEALLSITSTASSSLEIHETLTSVLNQVLDSIGSQAGLLTMVNPQTNRLDLLAYRLPEKMAKSINDHGLEGSLCDWVFRQKKPLVIDDLEVNSPPEAQLAIAQGFKSYQGVPVEAKGRALGSLCTFSNKTLSLRENDLPLLQAVGQQIGVAIENASLFEQTQEQAAELEILNEMSRVLSTLFDINQIIITIHEYTSKLMDTTYFFVALYDQKEDEVSFPYVVEKGEISSIPAMKKRRGLTQHVLDTREPLLIYDNVKEKIAQLGLEEIVVGAPAESWLGVPLIIGEEILGVIATQNAEKPRMFNNHHQELLISIARQSAIAIQTAGLFEETRKRVQDLTALSNASQSLAAAPLEITEVAAIISQQLSSVISGINDVSISLREPRTDLLRTIISSTYSDELGTVKDENPEAWSFSLDDYPATAEVLRTQKPAIFHASDPSADPNELEYMIRQDVSTLLILPLVLKGETIGVLEIETSKEEHHYTSEEIRLLITLANQAAISLENARLYDEQRQTAEQLRELDKLKSQFLANMSHELRTPLNSIIGFSRVIMKGIDGPVSDLQHQDLSAIYNAGQHLLKMINDILDISKIDAGKMELVFEDVNILEIINSVMSTTRGLVKDKPIELHTAIDENLPIIYADSTRIRQILLNLISNAAKFTDRGSITVTANQRISAEGQPEIYISVKDTGIGIPKKDREKLFEPFVQVDGSPTRATGGTGLGLSITRMLVDLHNGTIGLESKVGEGSTFYFTLPVNRQVPPFLSKDAVSILAIDDDFQVIQLYERYLNDTIYKIVPITDPFLAVNYARELKPFAITLDVLLPGHDGWKILEMLKTDPETRDIPVIICSILEERDKARRMGAQDYLVKPILADDFLNTIRRLAEAHSAA
jgi:signal transduction histidine kinase/CheY-like chemotaxis protein